MRWNNGMNNSFNLKRKSLVRRIKRQVVRLLDNNTGGLKFTWSRFASTDVNPCKDVPIFIDLIVIWSIWLMNCLLVSRFVLRQTMKMSEGLYYPALKFWFSNKFPPYLHLNGDLPLFTHASFESWYFTRLLQQTKNILWSNNCSRI